LGFGNTFLENLKKAKTSQTPVSAKEIFRRSYTQTKKPPTSKPSKGVADEFIKGIKRARQVKDVEIRPSARGSIPVTPKEIFRDAYKKTKIQDPPAPQDPPTPKPLKPKTPVWDYWKAAQLGATAINPIYSLPFAVKGVQQWLGGEAPIATLPFTEEAAENIQEQWQKLPEEDKSEVVPSPPKLPEFELPKFPKLPKLLPDIDLKTVAIVGGVGLLVVYLLTRRNR